MRAHRKYRLAAPALLAVLLAAAQARADGDARQQAADAQVLYDRAVAVWEQGRYETACPMLDETAKLAPDSIAVRIAAAECYLRLGRLATALSRYAPLEAAAAAKGQRARVAEVRARLDVLRARVAEIVVVVPDEVAAVPGLEVRCNGTLLGPSQLGYPFPVDRGGYEIRVTAPGRTPLTGHVEVEKDGERVSVRVALPNVLPPPPPAHPPPKVDLPLPAEPSVTRDARVPGIVLLSAGAAALGVGTVTGIVTLMQASAIKSTCQGSLCPPSQQGPGQQATMLGTVSTAEIIAGLAVAGAGVTLLVWPPAAGGKAAVRVTVRPGFVGLNGRF